jgi:hypothetical protein
MPAALLRQGSVDIRSFIDVQHADAAARERSPYRVCPTIWAVSRERGRPRPLALSGAQPAATGAGKMRALPGDQLRTAQRARLSVTPGVDHELDAVEVQSISSATRRPFVDEPGWAIRGRSSRKGA